MKNILIFTLSILSSFMVFAQKPNVIIVITDDQGYGDLGHTGNAIIKTPNIDEFSKESVNLTNFHGGTTCAPSRAGLLTGRNGNRNGVWHTINGASLLNRDEVTMAEVFQDNGYNTAMFGKWHLGDNHPFLPQDRGFQEAYYHGGGGVGQVPDYWNNDYFDDTYFRNGRPEPAQGYCTDIFFDEAIDFIEDKKDEPFFCYLSLNAPHSPFNVPQEYFNLYSNANVNNVTKRFYGMITNIDDNFGRLVDKLENLGIDDNTIVIFTTDNGSANGTFNAGMRGLKGSNYDGGHRVPFIIRWPNGNLSGGSTRSELTAHVDMLPTLANMAGVNFQSTKVLDGQNITNYLKGNDSLSERTLVVDTQRTLNLISGKDRCVMKGNWRLVNNNELYNISSDPDQNENIASQNANIVQELDSFYDTWMADVIEESKVSIIDLGVEPHEVLTSHDVRIPVGNTVWHQNAVRQGQIVTQGPWRVNFAESGTYRFSLQRWPEESGATLGAQFNRVAGTSTTDAIPNGIALNYKTAFLNIGGTLHQVAVDINKKSADFQLEMPAGQTEITAYFELENGAKGQAYYVYVDNDLSAEHIAISKPTSQSSTGFGGIASRAVDGNTNGVYQGNSVTHTNSQANSWWRVDLETAYSLSSIKVHNRTDCCSHRIENVKLYVGNTNSTNPNDYTLIGTLNDVLVNAFTDLNVSARYIMLRNSGTNPLSLAEVEVHGVLSENNVRLYSACDYGGSNISLGEGEYPDISNLGFPNDAVSSLRIPSGFEVILYQHRNFDGNTIKLTADDNCLTNNNFNNQAGSLKIIRSNTQSFIPDPNKTYYLDVPTHNLRLAANGQSQDAYTTSTNTTGADVEWKFVDKGNDFWHLQRAAGGSTPRLRTDATSDADMQATSSDGINTYYRFDHGSTSGTHYITLPDGPANFQRLQMTSAGEMKFVPTAFSDTWASWNITEVALSNLEASLFQHCNYTGSNISLSEGEYPNIANEGFPVNQLSSLRIPDGVQVILYQNTNFGGSSITLTADNVCLIDDDFNDRCSSLRIVNLNNEVDLYENCNYTGANVSLGIGDYPNVTNIGFGNDILSSLRIPEGLQVTLYQHYDFEGVTITLTADNDCLINNSFNNICSSIKIVAINNANVSLDPSLTLKNTVFNTSKATLYPNPASDFINIHANEAINVEAIYIYDFLGRIIVSDETNHKLAVNSTISMSIAHLEPGVYTIQLYLADGTSESHTHIIN